MLQKETKEGTDKCEDFLCAWTSRLCIVKKPVLPKGICRVNAMTIKTPMTFPAEIEKLSKTRER